MSVASSSLSLAVTDSFTLDSFVITSVECIPGISAKIFVLISASNGRVFTRTVPLDGDDYTAWIYDSYLETYVQDHIEQIYKS